MQIITYEPGIPYEAIATEVSKAGPNAVGPVSSIPINFSYKTPLVSLIFLYILSAPSCRPLLIKNSKSYNLSPVTIPYPFDPSPIIFNSELNYTKPTFLSGAPLAISIS